MHLLVKIVAAVIVGPMGRIHDKCYEQLCHRSPQSNLTKSRFRGLGLGFDKSSPAPRLQRMSRCSLTWRTLKAGPGEGAAGFAFRMHCGRCLANLPAQMKAQVMILHIATDSLQSGQRTHLSKIVALQAGFLIKA